MGDKSEKTAMRENIATPEGRELGAHLARFADKELANKRDDRCGTCAFRAGGHVANGSPETLMTALKCVMEREPFWCHEHDRPCAGWKALVAEKGRTVAMPWDYIGGSDLQIPTDEELIEMQRRGELPSDEELAQEDMERHRSPADTEMTRNPKAAP